MSFTAAEFHDGDNIQPYEEKYKALGGKMKIVSSDAHYLWNIKEKKEFFMLEDEPYSSANIRKNLFDSLLQNDGANL